MAEALLPAAADPESYRPLFGQTALWLPAMHEICRRHGLATADLIRIPEGSAIVFSCSEALIKLLPPFWAQEFAADRLGLAHCAGRLPVRTPELLAQGQLGDWPYLVLGRLPGTQIKRVWKSLAPAEQSRLMQQLGELIAVMQTLPTEDLPGDWTGFCASRRQNFVTDQQARGLSPELTASYHQRLEACLQDLPAFAEVFLHADLTDEHLLLEATASGWQLTGLIDFGDLMLGGGFYELAAPTVMLTGGRPELRRALLNGWGFNASVQELELSLEAGMLLHQFCHLPGWLKSSGAQPDEFRAWYCRL